MSKQHGEYLFLWWDGAQPDYFLFRGHLTEEELAAGLEREECFHYYAPQPGCSRSVLQHRSRDEYGPMLHRWARVVFANEWARADGCTHAYKFYDQPGRGCFPVTMIERKGAP